MKLTRKQVLNVLHKVCVSVQWWNQDGRPDLLLADSFTTSLQLLNRIRRNLTGSKYSTVSPLPSLWFSGLSEKPRWLPWPLIGWHILNFFPATPEFKETWQEARSQPPLPSFCFLFLGLIVKQRWLPSPLEPPYGIWWNFTGGKYSIFS